MCDIHLLFSIQTKQCFNIFTDAEQLIPPIQQTPWQQQQWQTRHEATYYSRFTSCCGRLYLEDMPLLVSPTRTAGVLVLLFLSVLSARADSTGPPPPPPPPGYDDMPPPTAVVQTSDPLDNEPLEDKSGLADSATSPPVDAGGNKTSVQLPRRLAAAHRLKNGGLISRPWIS